MAVDLEELRRRDREARSAKIYSSTGMERLRQAERGPPRTPAAALAVRHADERGREQNEQRAEVRQMTQRHEQERNRHLQTGRPLPSGLAKRQAGEREEMRLNHEAATGARRHRHMVERNQGAHHARAR